MSLFLGYLFIFLARITDVTLSTVRTLMVVQGRKIHAAIIGFFEVSIYIIILGKVVSNLNNVGNILAYALGFACGNFIGITIEKKIALGKLSVHVILKGDNNYKLIEELRNNGFGVTVINGEGKSGPRQIVHIAINRKDLDKLTEIIFAYDEKAFITANSINPINGGYYSSIRKKK